MKRNLQVNCNFPNFFKHFDVLKAASLNLELFLDNPEFDDPGLERNLAECGAALAGLRRTATVHAPFWDLSIGSQDSFIRDAAFRRLKMALEVSKTLQPELVVMHPAFVKEKYGHFKSRWLDHITQAISGLAKHLEGADSKIVLENIYDPDPEILLEIIGRVNDKRVGICFDTGHYNVFSQLPLKDYLGPLKDSIFEIHLHDNHGKKDEHLPLGSGSFDFEGFFELLHRWRLSPVLTLEMHEAGHLFECLDFLSQEKFQRMLPFINYPLRSSR